VKDKDGVSSVNPSFFALDSYTGTMQFGTSNKALHNHVYDVTLTCTSTQN